MTGSGAGASTGLVIVSHSAKIAEGVVELAAQMAGSTPIVAAGGLDDGAIGTSFDLVQQAITSVGAGGGGVVVLCDLGSAILTAETALDFLDDDLQARVRIADAPIVEGAVAAAVAAEGGAGLNEVVAAAESARGDIPPIAPETEDARAAVEPATSGTTVLVNRDGLHARPAAEFVKLAGTFDAAVTVNGVDAKSLLRIMSLGLRVGSDVTVTAAGPDADSAVRGLLELVDSGFGE